MEVDTLIDLLILCLVENIKLLHKYNTECLYHLLKSSSKLATIHGELFHNLLRSLINIIYFFSYLLMQWNCQKSLPNCLSHHVLERKDFTPSMASNLERPINLVNHITRLIHYCSLLRLLLRDVMLHVIKDHSWHNTTTRLGALPKCNWWEGCRNIYFIAFNCWSSHVRWLTFVVSLLGVWGDNWLHSHALMVSGGSI